MGNFNQIFRELRTSRGYSQGDLAELLEISRSAISMYENGNREPDFEMLEKIADLFSVDVNFLLGRAPAKTPEQNELHEPTYEEIQSLIARNGKNLTLQQKQDIIRTLLSNE